MATVKLIGNSTAGSYQSGNHALYDYFVAILTGIVSEIRLYTGAVTGAAKVAIYSNDSGHPGSLLASGSGNCSVANSWNIITLDAPLTIIAGTSYWLGTCTSADDVVQQYYPWPTTVYDMHYIAVTYSTFTFPATFDHTGHSSVASRMTTTAGWGVLVLSPSSISQPISYGSPKLKLSIKPSSLVQPIAYGTPTVATAALIIYPTSIVQSIAIGTPTLRYPQTISTSSIIQSISIGTPWVGIIGIIMPRSTVQPIAIGTPTVLKYVWHVILDGQYATETPEKNRLFVIGRDAYGNPVWGEAQDSTEIGLVGERLDFQQELAIPTTAQAASTADAILSKMRLTGKRGVILIPPNCGQEMFDVVELTDAMANQSAIKFRVVGIRFEYNPKQARYQHKLMLGAP